MSYRFTLSKRKDPGNPEFDLCDVDVRIDVEELSLDEVIDGFMNFLRACGYQEETIKKYLGEDE